MAVKKFNREDAAKMSPLPSPHFARYGAIAGAVAGTSTTTTPLPLALTEHLGGSRQYWRDIILGVNDGLISTFLLVAGVAGGGLSSTDILLTALAGSLAGAVSMATGEFVATKSQNEVMQGELALEQEHVDLYRDDEILELESLLPLIGIDVTVAPDLVQSLLQHYRAHPTALLKIMTVLEFGVIDDEVRSPIRAGLFSCLLFIVGSLPSVLPFLWVAHDTPLVGLWWAAICTTTALFVVGAVKTWATRGNWCSAAWENLSIAGAGGVLAYGVGVLFDAWLHHHGANGGGGGNADDDWLLDQAADDQWMNHGG